MKRKDLPEAVLVKLDEIRKERGIYAEVKLARKGIYYVYQGRSGYDHKRKKFIKNTTYIGRIATDGTFIEPKHIREPALDYISRHLPFRVNEAYEALKNRYENVFIKRIEDNSFYIYKKSKDKEEFIGRISETGGFTPAEQKEVKENDSDLMLLQCLSMNSRMKYKRMAEIAGLKNEHEAYSRVKSLVKRLDIRYTAEIDLKKLGYSIFFLFIRFKGTLPGMDVLREVFEGNSKIQFAAVTKGKYDIIAYLVDEDSFAAMNSFWDFINSSSLRGFKMRLNIVPFFTSYGFIPLREEFFNDVLSKRVYKKKRGTEKKDEIFQREFVLLKELAKDSSVDFVEIDKRYNLNKGSSNYTFKKLIESCVILNSTITLDNLPIRYVKIITFSINNPKKLSDTRGNLLS